ncbi:MAG: thioredoxin [Pseudomonadota bacterium]
MTTVVNDSNFESEVLNSDQPVLVDFFAEWCGPCKALSPVIEDLRRSFDGKAKVVKLDIDQSPATAQKYAIRSVPTLVVFNNGEARDSVVGVQSKGALETLLDAQVV